MILSGKTLREYAERGSPLVAPFVSEKTIQNGMSYGCSLAGYDIRIAETLTLKKGQFSLASSIEVFDLPSNVIGLVHDKSTWARRGLSLFNTVIEPGWRGTLTLELVNHEIHGKIFGGSLFETGLQIQAGDPIAQVIFMYTDQETEGYNGKYQFQSKGPQVAIFEDN
jgi:dCTP deaminase